jgi:hypothetical protein
VPAATVGAGLWVTPHTALEGSIGISRAQSVPWQWRYLFGGTASNQIATDRDVPVLGTVRVSPRRGQRVSVEPFLGGGYNFHRSRSSIIATCGPAANPTACVPLDTPTESDALTTAEWLIAVGADVPIQVSRRCEVLPGVRFMFARRRQYLTGYNHRGPEIGGGSLPGFGVTVRYFIR